MEAALRSRVLSILHLGSDCLDKGTWRVVGKAPPRAAPDSGPGGKMFEVGSTSYGSGGVLQDLAEACFGLSPWNAYADQNWLDSMLMAGVKRPANAKLLSPEERAKLGRSEGWVRR